MNILKNLKYTLLIAYLGISAPITPEQTEELKHMLATRHHDAIHVLSSYVENGGNVKLLLEVVDHRLITELTQQISKFEQTNSYALALPDLKHGVDAVAALLTTDDHHE